MDLLNLKLYGSGQSDLASQFLHYFHPWYSSWLVLILSLKDLFAWEKQLKLLPTLRNPF